MPRQIVDDKGNVISEEPEDDDYYDFDDDEELSDEELAAEECGRWDNGRLTRSCSRLGSEQCDFECPYRNSLFRSRNNATE